MRTILAILITTTMMGCGRTEEPGLSFPSPDQVFTIATFPYPEKSKPYFTPESLLRALPSFRPGKAEIKVGAKRWWQSGVIVLKNKDVLFWQTCRSNFIYIMTPSGHKSFILGDGKDNL